MNNATLLSKGIECLMKNLGLIEAERFISLIHTEKFDYTEWRKDNLFVGLTVGELAEEAMHYRREKAIS
ncbi:MAG: hypothetical protein FWG42_02460 [Clostridiales bacterium]|nr:hypothetical protein [Clostridiales bacterium]